MHAIGRLLFLFVLSALLPAALPRAVAARERGGASGAAPLGEAESLLRLLPPGAETMTVVPDVPAFMSAFLNTPFHSIYGDSRYRTFLAPMIELLEIDNPDLGALLRRPNALGRVPLTGALITAGYPEFQTGGGADARLVIYEVQPGDGSDFLELVLATSKAPGVRVNRDADPVAGHPVIALQRYRKIEETIEVRGDARKYRREMMEERGLDRYEPDFAPIATRREMSEELFFAGEDFVIRCRSRQLLAAVLGRIGADQDLPGLVTQPKWTAPLASMRTSPQALYYRDLRPDGRRGRKKFDEEERRLGLHEIRSLIGGLNLREDRLAIEVGVYVPAPRTGVGKLLFIHEPNAAPQFETQGFLPVEGYVRDVSDLVPADAVAYSAFSADMAELWTEAYRILQRGAPDVADLLDIYFQTQNTRGDFASRFASTFGSRWLTFSRFPEEDDRWSDEPEMTAMLEIRDAGALAPVLDHWLQNLAQLLNLQIEKFTVSGRRYFKLQGAESLDPRLTPLGPIAYICLAERWLILSVRQEHILAALARLQSRSTPGRAAAADAAPLMQEAGYEKLRASLPTGRFFEAYALPSATRHVMISPIMLLLGEGLDDASSALIDLEEAPLERVWRDAFGTIGVALRSEEATVVADFQLIYRGAAE